MTTPHRLGEPISDDSSQDDISQIRGLEEEQGIYRHPEVDVPPTYETDEDVPIKGSTASHENIAPKPRRLGSIDADDAGLPLEEHEDDDAFSIQNTIERLTHPGNPFDDPTDGPDSHGQDEEDEEEPAHLADYPPSSLAAPMQYPPGSPPAYSEDNRNAVLSPKMGNGSAAGGSSANSANNSVPTPLAGALTGMLLGQIVKPFESMAQKGKLDDASDDDDDYDDMDRPLVEQKKQEYVTNQQGMKLTPDEVEIIEMIDQFNVDVMEIEPVLMNFMCDFVCSIGDVDAFIKIPRPDEVEDNAGLTHLDEPSSLQSDPTILSMQLKNFNKEVNTSATEHAPAKKLARADKNSSEIDTWIANIKELHRSKPAALVHYTKPLPDVEKLMQEWPTDFERALHGRQLPTAELDVNLETFTDITLSLVDIPVHKSRIQSLHLLFSLYAEFKNSQHFRNLAQTNANTFEDTTDRLEL